MKKNIWYVVFVIICLLIYGWISSEIKTRENEKIATESAKAVLECAEMEIKADVYKHSQSIPEANSEIIYKNDQNDYIVISRYKCNFRNSSVIVDGSIAYHIRTHGKNTTPSVRGCIKQQDYDSEYDVETLKTIFRIK